MATETEIAATIWHEARGEGSDGMRAVRAVIQNREKYKCSKCGSNHGLGNWRSTTIFHGYSSTKPNVPPAEERIWQECLSLARSCVADNTGGATHFQRAAFNTRDYQPTVTIKNHNFAREKTEETRHR